MAMEANAGELLHKQIFRNRALRLALKWTRCSRPVLPPWDVGDRLRSPGQRGRFPRLGNPAEQSELHCVPRHTRDQAPAAYLTVHARIGGVDPGFTFARNGLVRHGPIPPSTAHWDLFLSIEQSPSLVDRMRNDRGAFGGETAVPHASVCRRHDSGAELLLRAGQNLVPVCLLIPDAECTTL